MPERTIPSEPDEAVHFSFLEMLQLEQGTRAAEALCEWLRGVEEGHQVLELLSAIVEDLVPIIDEIRERAKGLDYDVRSFDTPFYVSDEELKALRRAHMRLLCLGEINDTPAARFCYHFAQISLSAADEGSNLATGARLAARGSQPAADSAEEEEPPAVAIVREIVASIEAGEASRILIERFQEDPWSMFANARMRDREAAFEAVLERLRELIEHTEEAGVGLVIEDEDRQAIHACLRDLDDAKTSLGLAIAEGVFDEVVRLFVTGALRR